MLASASTLHHAAPPHTVLPLCSHCRVHDLRDELDRVHAAEEDAMEALRTQEELLRNLAGQLKEAAHSEISRLRAAEGRLLTLVQHSTQRLKAMHAQHLQQHAQLAELLHNPEQLLQLLLSGGYLLHAGGAVATAAAVFAAGRLTFSIQGAVAAPAAAAMAGRVVVCASSSGGSGGANAGGTGGDGGNGHRGTHSSAGGGLPSLGSSTERRLEPCSRVSARAPVVAIAAVQGSITAAPSRTSAQIEELDEGRDADVGGDDVGLRQSLPGRSGSKHRSGTSKWRSLLMSTEEDDGSSPTVLPAHLSELLLSDSQGGSLAQHLHRKAAEAAAATQVLHVLQEQEAEVAVKSAELAASSLAAEQRLAEAVKGEAQAVGQLLEVQQASTAAAAVEGRKKAVSRRGSSKSEALKLATTAMQEQLADARVQVEEAVAARAAAQQEVEGLKAALQQEQNQVRDLYLSSTCLNSLCAAAYPAMSVLSKLCSVWTTVCVTEPPSDPHDVIAPCHVCVAAPQSSAIAQHLASTQAELSNVSAELCSMRELLQERRFEHARALVAATAGAAQHAAAAGVGNNNNNQHVQDARQLQLAEQRLSAELSEAKKQLDDMLQELTAEKGISGQLHEQVASLRRDFADARALIDAERSKAAALQHERARLEAALQEAASAAASAEADAAAARQKADKLAQQAERAAAEAEGARSKLADVSGHNKELGQKLHVAVEVVAQQQAMLERRASQVDQLQQEVAHTREYGASLRLELNPICSFMQRCKAEALSLYMLNVLYLCFATHRLMDVCCRECLACRAGEEEESAGGHC